jgi:Protein of unknown function (DUF3800)
LHPPAVGFRGLVDGFHLERERIQSEIPLNETVDFIFDDQTEKSFIMSAWNEYLAARPDDIRDYYGATPRFENDQKFLPLQAADLWAWWVRRWYEEDAITVPDKMRAFDFGKWRGKRRPVLAFSYSEERLGLERSGAASGFGECARKAAGPAGGGPPRTCYSRSTQRWLTSGAARRLIMDRARKARARNTGACLIRCRTIDDQRTGKPRHVVVAK